MDGLLNKAKSVGSMLANQAGAAKQFVVQTAHMASLKVSGQIWGPPEDPFLDRQIEKGERFILEIIEANDVPRCDIFSPSDPFVQGYISVEENGKFYRMSEVFSTPIKADTDHPVWHCFHDLNCVPPCNSYLAINLYDSDFDDNAVLKSRTLLGRVHIPISKLSTESTLSERLKFHQHGNIQKNPNFNISLRRAFLHSPPPSRKTFFIIRHGESKWNRAEEKKDIPGLLAFDHPLTDKGIAQVLSPPAPPLQRTALLSLLCRRNPCASSGRRPPGPWTARSKSLHGSRTRIWRRGVSTRRGSGTSTSACSSRPTPSSLRR